MIQTFKRYELKYLINAQQFQQIQVELNQHMELDEFCSKTGYYRIYNVYFDTEHDDIIRKSISKPYYKEKLRLRSYGCPLRMDEPVFFELKKKIGGVVAKRRAVTNLNQVAHLTEKGLITLPNRYKDRQVHTEIAAFLKKYNAKPKVYISYQRTAYFEKVNPDLRISFDRNILTRRDQVNLLSGDYGTELLEKNQILMEVKCDGHLPLWLSRSFTEQKVFRTSFSKYGTEFKKYCIEGTQNLQKLGVQQYVR